MAPDFNSITNDILRSRDYLNYVNNTTNFWSGDNTTSNLQFLLEITSALRVSMDNTHIFQNITSCRLNINAKGSIIDSSLDDNFLTLTAQASPSISELREAKLLRQSSLPHSCNDGAIMDDSISITKQKQTYCSVASLLPSLPCSPSKTFSSVKKRLSNFDQCRPQSPRKSHQKQYGNGEENMARYDSPPVAVSQISHMLNNVRGKDLCHNDDKENESPKAAEIINSPKMKITDNILAEQNSPIRSDSSRGHFSFSPKQNHAEDMPLNGANWPLVNAVSEQSSCYSNTSPLLNSAVYKHGNYFKFPEVDSLSCEQSSDETSIIYNRPLIQKGSIESQASRRVRLKSISLDSDGARLVEDNLGIPVEELVQYANEIQPASSKATIDQKQIENVCTDKSKSKVGNKEYDATSLCVPFPATNVGSKVNRKNRNNLQININKGTSTNLTSLANSNEFKSLLKVQTPKTPTLTQSKQKAFSLDSSESNNMLCPIVQSSRKPLMQHSTMNLRASQLSSISVPTTPKRQASRKKSSGKPNTAMKPPNIKVPSNQLTPLNSVLKPLDYKQHLCTGGIDEDQSLQIAIDFDDNYGDEIDDITIDNFYSEEVDDDVLVVTGNGSKINHDQVEVKKRTKAKLTENEGHFLGSSLHMQKSGTLSLSNNNLETLPEVMTLTDFGDFVCNDTATLQPNEKQKSQASEDIRCGTTKAATFSRANILQRRGSNQSLTINLNMNGSLGNLTKCMSASNYSLGSFTGSNYNLNNCPQHQMQMCQQIKSNTSSTQSIATHGCSNSQLSISHPYNSSPLQQQNSFEVDLTQPDSNLNRKNILQRRGSNTSLTLNLKGTSAANLSRFNSHSSLNISSIHSTINSNSYGKIKPYTQHYNTYLQQPQLCNQYYQSQVFRQQQVNKKGLLERRNSNASLTLNIQSNALTASNYNLRASVCSLNNITNTSAESFENSNLPSNQNTKHEKIDIDTSTDQRHQRKFLSSENLNAMVTQCNRLNQTHVRNSIKTCFGSVSDLKPSAGNSTDFQMKHVVDSDYSLNMGNPRQFGQSNLCSCTGVRNISTKPLSPQSTSEDFKMYLANIQLLQNATNVLTEDHLRKLHYIFEERYEIERIRPQYGKDLAAYSEPYSYNPALNKQVKPNSPIHRSNHFLFDAIPNDDEKKLLRRSLHEEFWDLPTNHQEKPLVFGSQSKNRYKTILPNEHSRVILKTEYGTMQEPYINANYIKGPDYARNSYIVTQGPLPNTIYDYWLMIQQNIEKYQRKPHQNEMEAITRGCKLSGGDKADIISEKNINYFPQKIVMLTNFIENNQQKCSIYFPVENNQIIFITNSNERFESSELAALYDSYLNSSSEIELSQESGLTLELDDRRFNYQQGCNTDLKSSNITNKNFFLIKNCGIQEMEGYSIRQLTVLYVISIIKEKLRENQVNSNVHMTQVLKKFTCYHYWFPDWPDHHSPEDVGLLLDMSLHLLDIRYDREFKIMAHKDKDVSKPSESNNSVLEPILNMCSEIEPIPIIHCSAGIGRTGCLAAILNGIRQIRSSILHSLRPCDDRTMDYSTYARSSRKSFVNVDVLGIVCNLRLQRGGMVQNSEQYELIHRALCLYQSRIDAELSISQSKTDQPATQLTIGTDREK